LPNSTVYTGGTVSCNLQSLLTVVNWYEVSAGTVPYTLLKTLQVRYRIPSATGMGYGNFR